MNAPTAQWRPVYRACPVCGAERFRVLGSRGGRSHHAGRGVETEITRCLSCHAVYPRPFLIPDTNPYRAESEDYFAIHELDRKIALGRSLAKKAETLLGRKGELLDLGCGRGELLLGAREEGWRVRGVDMTEDFALQSPDWDLEVELSPVETATSLEGKRDYDVIFLAAILEHLYEPRACLERVHSALTEDGIVFIDVPNECSLATRVANTYFRLRGREWCVNLSPTFPPFHVVGFCPSSLRYLLEDVGFDLIELRVHPWYNNYTGSSLWKRIEGHGWAAAMHAGAALGMGDGITCWARRRAFPADNESAGKSSGTAVLS